MGAYRALARPLFFALPPEGAHRVAGGLLRLRLPWRSMGGAVEDPVLRTDLAGIALRNPIGLAAGFDKSCRFLPALGELGFGYLVAGTVTHRPRSGNPKPRIVRRPGSQAMVNSMGLPNRGVDHAAKRLVSMRRTAPVLISLADEELADVVANHCLLEPLVDGVELNASCPNVSWGRDRDNEQHLRQMLTVLSERKSRPLFVKLPPYRTDKERDAILALAGIAQEGGADGLTCFNTLPVPEPRLATRTGGLSGRDLFEHTLAGVAEVARTTGGELPINACGGIFSGDGALACLEAGARTVQIYTALIYEGPRIVRRMTGDMARSVRPERVAESPRSA